MDILIGINLYVMIKTVFFDLDDTILDFKKAERIALQKTFNTLGLPSDDKILSRYSVINAQQWQKLETGELTREQVKVTRYEHLFEEFNLSCCAETATGLYENNLAVGHYFIDGAEKLLSELFGIYDLYLVSNGAARVQKSRIKSAGIAKYFKDIFISQEIGFDKPDKRFFDICFSKIPNFSREEAIIVGDSPTSDIQGGINAEIKTCRFNPKGLPNSILPDCEIKTLSQLKDILKKY